MNEKHIQQVIEIEKQAQEIYETALRDAEKLPRQAEIEAQALIDQARLAAEEEVRQMIANAQAEEEARQILAKAEERNQRLDEQAAANFHRAVSFIVARVTGEE